MNFYSLQRKSIELKLANPNEQNERREREFAGIGKCVCAKKYKARFENTRPIDICIERTYQAFDYRFQYNILEI